MTIQALFVYGSLAPGRSHHHLVADLPGTWCPAWVRGHLYPQGRGPTRGWPALYPDANAAPVPGFLLATPALRTRWAVLDRFEGRAYRRQLCPVTLTNDRTVMAQVYVPRWRDKLCE